MRRVRLAKPGNASPASPQALQPSRARFSACLEAPTYERMAFVSNRLGLSALKAHEALPQDSFDHERCRRSVAAVSTVSLEWYVARGPFNLVQDFAEEEQEFQAGIDDSRFRRRTRAPTSAAPQTLQPPSNALAEAESILQCYAMCLQHGLQARMTKIPVEG